MEKKVESNMAVLSTFSISEVSSKFDLNFTKGLAEKVKELMFIEEHDKQSEPYIFKFQLLLFHITPGTIDSLNTL